MKQILLFVIALVGLSTAVSCDSKREKEQAARMEAFSREDSLQQVINQMQNESSDLHAMRLQVQDIMQQINTAEGRITNLQSEGGNNSQAIVENMAFIQQKMREYRESIEEMQQLLRNAKQLSEKEKEALRTDIVGYQQQLARKDSAIAELRRQVEENERLIAQQGQTISQQDQTIAQQNSRMKELTNENANKERAMVEQDKQLHTAWYVFGTKKELQEQHILEDGKVMRSASANKSYFTEIDIRVKKTIPLYSKKVSLLSNHPTNSYSLDKDASGFYTLRITNANSFWSSSRYLVVQVK